MKYGYARVSTAEQNVNQQVQKLIDQYHIDPSNIVQEVWTGKTTERPALQKLVNKTLKAGDKLYVFHISRLGRKASEVLQLVDELKERKRLLREQAVEPLERAFLIGALERNDWNITRAADDVGILRPNFQAMLKKQGIHSRQYHVRQP